MEILEQLIGFVRDIIRLRGDTSIEVNEERELTLEKIQIIGRTAAFFGGFDGMKKLHDTCEAMTCNRNEIGNVLNWAWDNIGDWCS